MDENQIEEWETVGVEQVADCCIFRVHRTTRKSPLSGRVGEFHTIDSPDWVNVVALTSNREIVMIRQYRHGIDHVIWEIPGGMMDPGELPQVAGARELLEETGYTSESVHVIGCAHSNPALFNNKSYTVLATGARRVAAPSLDEHEEIAVELYTLDQVDQMVKDGTITHSLVLNALLWFDKWQQQNEV